jgi:tetrahydromethanopterin S-methyltransferase subunit G
MEDNLDKLNEYLEKITEEVKGIYANLGYELKDNSTLPELKGKVELSEDDINKLLSILDNIDERLAKE